MDPTVLTPSARFAVTDRFGEPRSPSRSPNRRNYFTDHELDPLLSNLSPTSTLEALEATDVFASNRSAGQDALQQSVAAASTAERALGIRAALAGKKLREWYNDLSAWPWPENSVSKGDGFRMRPSGAHERKVKFYSHEGHIENVLSDMDVKGAEEAEKDDSCGSIPAKLVQDYEDRIETIRDDMEALGVEDLKDFVRDAHVISNARRNSRRIHGNGMTWAGYNHLDDFTAVITATIMQALPTISRLNSLLAVWSTRLLVLRQVPEFLALLDETNGSITGAWAFLNDTFEEAKDEEFHTNTQSMDGGTDSKRAIVLTKRADLESQIFELGRRLDNMLDELEGREDTIPEEWIDGMESIEAEFGDWVVEAEKKFMEYEWKMHEKNAMQGSHKAWPNSLSGAGKLEDIPSISRQHETTDVESQNKEIERSLGYVSSSHRSSPSSGADGEEYRQEGAKDVLIYIEPVTPSTSVTTSNIQKSGPSQKDISFNTDIASKSPFTLLPSTVHEVIHEISAQNLKDEETIITGEQNHPDETSHLAQDSLGANLTKILSYENSELNQETGNKELNKDQNTSTESQPDEVNFSNDHSNANAASPTQPASIPNDKLEIVDSDISRLLLVAASSPSLKNSKDQLLGYSKSKQSMTPRPAPLVLRKVHSNIESTASSEISTDTSYPNSGTSDYFSNLSSPEIRHASVAEYFDNPVEIMTPSRVPSTPLASISRQSSQRTERDRGKTHEDGSPSSYIESTINRRRASSFVPVSTNPKTAALADELQSRRDYAKSHIRVRSASLKSFEIVPRNEVRNITISRKGSYCSPAPAAEASAANNQQVENSIFSDNYRLDQDARISPINEPAQEGDEEAPPTSTPSPEATPKKLGKTLDLKPSPRFSAKSRHRFETVSDFVSGSTSAKLRRRKTAETPSESPILQKNLVQPSTPTALKNSEDQLEARISSILTEIPGHIRLRSGPEPDAPEVLPLSTNSGRKKYNLHPPIMKLARAQTSAPSSPLTLAPVHSKLTRSRTQAGDPEIKLYHLHQTGKDKPVKLFVRLVGEGGERVMVRIGGGWADLGEYLKEYAVHHGRRSISDGRFEIQGLPQAQPTTPKSSLAGFSSPAPSPASRPTSSAGLSSASHTHLTKRHSNSSSADLDLPITPENPPYRPLDRTPGSLESSISSLRPASRLSFTDEDSPLGLAGPTTRRKDVSPSKQAWVDGMLDQARKASAEKTKKGESEFGDLGTVGGTKRVFLRGRKEI